MNNYDLSKKGVDLEKIAEDALSDENLFKTLMDEIKSKDNTVRFNAFNTLLILSENNAEFLYPHWDYFQDMLDSQNNYHKYIAVYLLANLTAVDSENRFNKIFNGYFGLVEGNKAMIASHVILNSSKIANNKPELKSEIIEKLLLTDELHKGKQKELIKSYVIETLRKINPEDEDRIKIEGFVKLQLDSSSPKTRSAAKCYIERCELD